MPMMWTEPAVALEHNGVTVWHTYKNDCMLEYWYTVEESDDDSESDNGAQFDVRDLDIEGTTHEEIIRNAIDAGMLSNEEPYFNFEQS